MPVIAARRTDTEITFTGTYTCTHHNDQQRAACPVCLVATLTAERDQLRAEVAKLRVENNHNWQFQEISEEALKRAEMLAKCHEDNCRSISQLSRELGQARDAERLVRMQLANARETLQRFSSPIAQAQPRALPL